MSLREGFTTGTAAAAAAKAAALLLARGRAPVSVDVALPNGQRLDIPVLRCTTEGDGARGVVVKDGGDDPDATHGAAVEALVRLRPAPDGPDPHEGESVAVDGGRGVGRVTRPGLPVAVGLAAINPAPLAQIKAAVAEALPRGLGAEVLIEVPGGEALAQKTLNPRLGIVGGVSILGTRGTVKPYSHEAYIATIRQCLDMAVIQGVDRVGLATGGRSERLLRELYPSWPETAFVPVADFFAETMEACAARGVRAVVWGLFFGKLCKQAAGHRNTHAKHAALDLDRTAAVCREAGLGASLCRAVATSHTALEALERLKAAGREASRPAYALLARHAARHAAGFAGAALGVDHALFDFDGSLLYASDRMDEEAV